MRGFVVLVIGVLALGSLIFGQYYFYVTNTKTPYDEVGIMLNGWMPGPVKDWGCGKLQANFGGGLPPLGCQSAGNQAVWR